MTDNDNILSEPQMHRVYDVARAVNVVNVKVEALRRQVEQHIAAADGADPVEGEQAADGEAPQPEMSPVFAGQLHDLAQLRALTAENAALRAKVNAHEKEMIDYIEASAAMYRRRTADLRAERDAAQARVAELEKERDDLYQQVDGLTKQVARLHAALENAAGPDAVREAIYQSVDAGEADYPALGLRARQNAADAALGALVRRGVEAHRKVEIMRSTVGRYFEVLIDYLPEDAHDRYPASHGNGQTLDDALRAALGEEATDAE